MQERILRLLKDLEPLVRKEAQKEFKDNTEPKLYTEMLKEITFYIEELKGGEL